MAGAGDIEPSRWMGRLLETSERANSMPLWRLWIPGSHETGTWALKGESKSALDTVDVIAGNKVVFEALKAVEKIPGVRQAEHAAIANWSRTQSRTTHQQLELGIRSGVPVQRGIMVMFESIPRCLAGTSICVFSRVMVATGWSTDCTIHRSRRFLTI